MEMEQERSSKQTKTETKKTGVQSEIVICGIVIYNKEHVFGPQPSSCHSAPKTLGISCEKSN